MEKLNLDGITKILGATVTVALVTTIVTNKNSVGVIREFGRLWSNSLLAAQGKGRVA
jgi:hypothetical protein